MKWRLYLLFVVFCGTTLPVMNSILTKFRLERVEKEKAEAKWKEMNREVEEMELRTRFKY